jgi:hypothetical protein
MLSNNADVCSRYVGPTQFQDQVKCMNIVCPYRAWQYTLSSWCCVSDPADIGQQTVEGREKAELATLQLRLEGKIRVGVGKHCDQHIANLCVDHLASY